MVSDGSSPDLTSCSTVMNVPKCWLNRLVPIRTHLRTGLESIRHESHGRGLPGDDRTVSA